MSAAGDSFIEAEATVVVIAIPIIFLAIAVGPFIYLWRKKKPNFRNILATTIVVLVVEVIYIYLLSWGFELLGSAAVNQLYGS